MGMISFKMVIDKDIFPQKWESFFKEGYSKILENSLGEQTEEMIYNDLWLGKLFMKIILTEKGYAGFYTGKVTSSYNSKSVLNIVHTYIKEGNEKILEALDEDVNKMAIQLKCDVLNFLTLRDRGFEKRLRDMGWQKGYVELYREVKNGRV
jgi:hypothetical protein